MFYLHIVKRILLIAVYFFLCACSNSTPKTSYDRDIQPTTLYSTTFKPLTFLAEKTWNISAQSHLFQNYSYTKEMPLGPYTLKLPLIKNINPKKPVFLILDYAGLNNTNRSVDDIKTLILIENTMGCPTIPNECSYETIRSINDIGQIFFDTKDEFENLDRLIAWQLPFQIKNSPYYGLGRYRGWLTTQEKNTYFIAHHTEVIPPQNNLQLYLTLTTSEGIDTKYLTIRVTQDLFVYEKLSFTKRFLNSKMMVTSLYFYYAFLALMILTPFLFIHCYKTYDGFPDNNHKIFAILLILWGVSLFVVNLSVSRDNLLISLGALITSSGILFLFKQYLALGVLILALIINWLFAFQLKSELYDILKTTGLLTLITIYVFFSGMTDDLE